MTRGLSYLSIAAVFLLVWQYGTVVAKCPPEEGGVLPEINLAPPPDESHRDYLGLSDEDRFQIPEIKAEVVIVEIFSMYCPHCQRAASEVNKLYDMIEKDPKIKPVVKVIGIGAGNSPFEVNVFRKTYTVPFPLFADADFSIHECLGEVRTPYFIGVKIKDDGGHEVFYSKLGGFEKAEVFLQQILTLSGLK